MPLAIASAERTERGVSTGRISPPTPDKRFLGIVGKAEIPAGRSAKANRFGVITTMYLSSQAPKLALLLVGVIFLTGCPDSKVEVQRVGPNMPSNLKRMKGVFYALPRTMVLVRIPFNRTDKFPGKYEKFARCFFPEQADARFKIRSTEFEIGDGVGFETKGEPDPEQIFMVNTKAGLFQTKSLLMQYTDDGILGSAKAETKDESLDFAVSALKTIASIGVSIITHGAIPGGLDFKVMRDANRRERRPPSEIKQLAEQLKARAEVRRCYNFYVSAAAQRTRIAGDQLNESIAAIAAAQGTIKKLDETLIFAAVIEAQNAVVNNNRAITLANEAITKAEEEARSNTNDAPLPDFAHTSQRVRKPQRRAGVKPADDQRSSEAKPVKEKSAQELYEEALDFEAAARNSAALALQRSEEANKQLTLKHAEANTIAEALPNSYEKNVAIESIAVAGKSIERANVGLAETFEINANQKAAEFSDRFLGEYYEANIFAERIRRLEDKRQELVSTSADLPKDTLQLMLSELDATLKAFKDQYFLGVKKTATWSTTLQYLPPSREQLNAKGIESIALFDFSEKGGVCGGEVLEIQGIRVHSDFKIKSKCGDRKSVNLILEKLKSSNGIDSEFASVVASAGFVEGQGLKSDERRGFYYRIPGRSRLRLSWGPGASPDNEIKREVVTIAQLGAIASLPISTGGRRTSYNLTLDTATGALRNFELGADAAIQNSMLEDAGNAAKSIIEAKDPLERLKRRKEFLETLKGVKDAEKALTDTNGKDNDGSNGNSNGEPTP